MTTPFEQMLTGGHPNSLGRTVEVVELILSKPEKLEELYNCYFSADEVVRLRTSSALKRITQKQPEWVVPYIDRLLNEISKIDQASTQWTLATLFDLLKSRMSRDQQVSALTIMKNNLATHGDWIVLNTTMQTLFDWSKSDAELKQWLTPQLERLTNDGRKSVSKRAAKLLALSPNQ